MDENQTPGDLPTSTNPPLSDAQLAEGWPAAYRLVKKLEDIAARDAAGGVVGIAASLVEYFRTQDAE
jgi:hypothetical protein